MSETVYVGVRQANKLPEVRRQAESHDGSRLADEPLNPPPDDLWAGPLGEKHAAKESRSYGFDWGLEAHDDGVLNLARAILWHHSHNATFVAYHEETLRKRLRAWPKEQPLEISEHELPDPKAG
jgi:hypothetical protein